MNISKELLNHPGHTLTVYFPFRATRADGKDRTKDQQTKLKGLVEGELRTAEVLQDHKDFRLQIVDAVEKIGGELDFAYEGVAIFLGFDPKKEEVTFQETKYLSFIPPKEVRLGDGFYLTPLLQNLDQSAIVSVELSRYAARISTYAGGEFEILGFEENEHIEMDEVIKEEMKQYQGGYGWWNTGEDTDWIDEEEKHFLKDLREKISRLEADVLVLFISTNFQKIQPSLVRVMGDLAPRVHVIPKQNDGQWSVKEELIRIEHETHQEMLKEKASDLQENAPAYVTETEALIKGIYTGQFDYLLISNDFDFTSLDEHKDLVAKFAQKDSVEYVWRELEKTLLDLGADIYLLDAERYGVNNLLAGHKRFEMNPE